MNRAFKTEYYPDMTDRDWGKKVLTLSCAVTNGKRFKQLTLKDKTDLVEIIERFEKSLTAFKNELTGLADWEANCNKYYGKVLIGKYRHYCYDWDGLPIDETCEEFKCCACYSIQSKHSKDTQRQI